MGTFGSARDDVLVFVPNENRFDATPLQRKLSKWLPWLFGGTFIALPVVLPALLADRAGGGVQGYLKAFEAVVLQQPWLWIKLLTQALAAGLLVWLVMVLPSRGRLELSRHELRYRTNIPVLQHLLDWRLNLDDVRAERIRPKWAEMPNGLGQLPVARLTWGHGMRYVVPANWSLMGQTSPPLRASVKTYGWASWRHPENQQAQKHNLMTRPLMMALQALDVPLPPFDGRGTQNAGLDLNSYPRIRAVLGAVAVLVLLSTALYFWTSADFFTTAPAPWLVWGAGGAAACSAWLWMWPDHALPEHRQVIPHELGLAKVFCAGMVGIGFAWCMPQALLTWAKVSVPEQTVRYVVQHGPTPYLKSINHAGQIPRIYTWPAGDRVSAVLDESTEFDLALRRGYRGWWWQYDAEPLLEAARAHYEKLPAS